MPSTRYTVRLPPPLDAAVHERVRQGTPFATLVREALSAYLADTPPTAADTLMDLQDRLIALTVRVEFLEQSAPTPPPTAADSLSALQVQVEELTTQVKVIEEILTRWPQVADTSADRTLTPADSAADTTPTAADTPHPGRRPSPLRQQILDVLQRHPEGLRAEEIRVHVQAQRPIGDTLQGMRKAGVITTEGQRPDVRYRAADSSTP
jgi:hypothetical protein